MNLFFNRSGDGSWFSFWSTGDETSMSPKTSCQKLKIEGKFYGFGLLIYLKNISHFSLLYQGAVIFNRQYDRKIWRHKRMVLNIKRVFTKNQSESWIMTTNLNCLYNINKFDFCSEGMAVKDDRHAFRTVPTIQLNRTATHSEATSIGLNRRFAWNLKFGDKSEDLGLHEVGLKYQPDLQSSRYCEKTISNSAKEVLSCLDSPFHAQPR